MPELPLAICVDALPSAPSRWAGAVVRLPAQLIAALADGATGVSFAEEASRLRLLRAFTKDYRPLSSRLPISYQAVPGWARSLVASAIGRWQSHRTDRWAAFPGWPLDLSADFVADLGGETSPFESGPTPVILSHDLDSPQGLRNLGERFLVLEEAAGARSVNFIVPCAWPINHGLVEELVARGHEVGIHGFDHSNKTPFVDAPTRAARLRGADDLISRYAITGYRAPSLVRTRELIQDLRDFYIYDSSIPTSGGLFPVPNNGCASARPFLIDGLPELPVSMPRDGSLRFLGHSAKEILALWIDCAERIATSRGVVVLLTHCEDRFCGSPAMLETYQAFLEYIAASERFAWSSPADVTAHLNRGKRE